MPSLLQCCVGLIGCFIFRLIVWDESNLFNNISQIGIGFVSFYITMAFLNGFKKKEGSSVSHYDWLLYRLFLWRWNPILDRNPVMKEMMFAWMKASDVVDNGTEVKVTVTIEPK